MAVSVTQITKSLSITQQEVLALLRQQGVNVSDINNALSDSDFFKNCDIASKEAEFW